ncbi:YtpR family tRNA-binding protein [Ornithinibacillus sp. 179-J 7C1 HS]|uniref:YtpR family tRNA-binding protein n=1 Tax=Ornithinibacillus sp. 179-J 7C1 HS TaxID=3142384 RepID=UPI00399FB156
MDVFYNPKGIGDVLIIPIEETDDRYSVSHEIIGPVTKIIGGNNEVLGYNIANASTYFSLSENGKINLTNELLDEIKNLFEANNINDTLDFDLSPKFVVGYVLEKEQHENADKLSVCKVDVGDEVLQIVCGAPNVDKGQKVVVAKVGATMPSGLRIKPTELRGVASNGMICSQKELGMPNAPKEKGIYVLDDSYSVGQAFPV